MFMIGFIGIISIVGLCLFSPMFIAHDPLAADLEVRLKPPEWLAKGWKGHIFGTDPLGRDVLTRVLIGGRFSLFISFTVVFMATFIGIIVGLSSGFYAGKTDSLLMRICDITMATPQLLLAICIVAVLGPSNFNLIVVIVVTSWAASARIVRGVTLTIRNSEYIQAARVLAAGDFRIMLSEILPNTYTPILISVTQSLGITILIEASMSFLGMGVPLPKPSWGTMISDGREYIAQAPWIVVVPGVALMLTVLAFNFLGDGFRDALDPKNTN
jgi:ABC-type dipeptide/oligopeptide/nickel transport system permease subunit